jgi:hypothetical protein
MKADIRKIMASIDIAGLWAGGKLEEHGKLCTLCHVVGAHSLLGQFLE